MKENNIKSENSLNPNLIGILKGTLAAFIITAILLIIYSTILCFTNISETTMPITLIIISAFSVFIGSIMASIKIKSKGLINGLAASGIYIGTIYLLSSLLNMNFSFTLNSAIMIITSLVLGICGGIIGVNLNK